MISLMKKPETDIWAKLKKCHIRPADLKTAFKSIGNSDGKAFEDNLINYASIAVSKAAFIGSKTVPDKEKAYTSFIQYVKNEVEKSEPVSKSYYWLNIWSNLFFNNSYRYDDSRKIKLLLEIAAKSVEYYLFLQEKERGVKGHGV